MPADAITRITYLAFVEGCQQPNFHRSVSDWKLTTRANVDDDYDSLYGFDNVSSSSADSGKSAYSTESCIRDDSSTSSLDLERGGTCALISVSQDR